MNKVFSKVSPVIWFVLGALGQPHRIKHVDRVLAHIKGLDGVWSASGSQIFDAARSQIS